MHLIITIDTEEDAWGCYQPTGHTVENIKYIPILQHLFDEFDAKPTYLITYPVASDDTAIDIFGKILAEEKCEVGTHLHPWNTPPFDEETGPKNSMLCNLPQELQYKKIRSLHEKIREKLAIEPVSFRAGRWGYGQGTAKALHALGYKIDTSILPYTDWSQNFGPDSTFLSPKAFQFACNDIFRESSTPDLFEIPASAGYMKGRFSIANWIWWGATRSVLRHFKAVPILQKLRMFNPPVWLSPETADANQMIQLARNLTKNGYQYLNLFFHSPSLKCGLSPFVRSLSDEKRFLDSIRQFLSYAKNEGIPSIRLSDSLNCLSSIPKVGS